jgi:uncharacterized membrane protein
MAFAHNGVRWILGGWTGFLAEKYASSLFMLNFITHLIICLFILLLYSLVLSHNRDEIIERFGADRYHFLYNSLSSITTLSIAYGYFRYGRGAGPVVAGFENVAPALRQFSSFALQALGLIGFSQMAPKLQIPVIMKSSAPQSEFSAASSVVSSSARFQSRCPIDFASAKRPAGVDPNAPYGFERITRHPQLWSLAFLGLGSAMASPFVAERVLFGYVLFLCNY